METINEERTHIFVGETTDDKLSNYRIALNKTIQQNSELRAKLNNIHITSDTSNFPDPVRIYIKDFNLVLIINDICYLQVLSSSLSYSSGVSGSEVFFDAEEYQGNKINEHNETITGELVSGDVAAQTSDTSSEAGSLSSEDGSISSENSDGATSEYNNPQGRE